VAEAQVAAQLVDGDHDRRVLNLGFAAAAHRACCGEIVYTRLKISTLYVAPLELPLKDSTAPRYSAGNLMTVGMTV